MDLPFKILVIDDESVMRDSCFQILSRKGCDVSLSENGLMGLNYLKEYSFDIVILDLKMPDVNGLEILKTIRMKTPETSVIVITGYPTVETAVKAMKMGACDFIPKPFTPNMLRTVVSRTLEKRKFSISNSGKQEIKPLEAEEAIVGTSPFMKELKQFIKKAGISDCSVLITGETGTGKELVARSLHYYSSRRNRKFVTVDSGGLVDTLIESELFGHVRGAFTGALYNRIGRFEIAHQGTLFFDEISNMSFRIQSKLLRALQEGEITRVGTSQQVPVDVRIIAATNKNLEHEIEKGSFRKDLFYRLNVIPIHLPPLRERREDIPVLARHFFDRFCHLKHSAVPERISERAMKTMIEYNWPGNIRELEHIIKRAVALSEDCEVDPLAASTVHQLSASESMTETRNIRQLDDVEKAHIVKILKKFNNNKSRTARELGIDRKTLRSKIRKYNIYVEERL